MKFLGMRMIAPFLLVLSLNVIAIQGQQDCNGLNAVACIAVNVEECTSKCINNELDILQGIVTIEDNCTGHDNFCALATCCQPCQEDIVQYKNCLFQQCDSKSCDGIVPTAPSPSAPSNIFAPVNISFPELPDLCITDLQSLSACVMTNAASCTNSCSELDLYSEDPTCDALQEFCAIKSCCPNCQDEVTSFVDCISNTLSCNADCSSVSVQPMAPSPPTPTLNIPPVIFDPNELIECQNLVNNWLICVTSNIDSCMKCGEPSSELINLSSCENIDTFCEILTCCDACSDQGKAAGSCTTGVFQCPNSCGDFSPFEPSSLSFPNISLPSIMSSFQPILAPAISSILDSELNTTKAPNTPIPVSTVPVSDKSSSVPISIAPVIVNTSSVPISIAPVIVNTSSAPTSTAPVIINMTAAPIPASPVSDNSNAPMTPLPTDGSSSAPITKTPVAVTTSPESMAPVVNSSSMPTRRPSAKNGTDGSSMATFSRVHSIVTLALLAVTIATF